MTLCAHSADKTCLSTFPEYRQLQVPNVGKNPVRLEIEHADIAFDQNAMARLISDYGSKYDVPLAPRTHTSDQAWSWSFVVPVRRQLLS